MNNNDQRLWSFPEITVDLLGPERPTAQLSTSHGPTFHRNTFVHQLETNTEAPGGRGRVGGCWSG